MKEKVWINKPKSFKQAKEFDYDYYSAMTPEERVETVQFLRALFFKLRPNYYSKGKKGSKHGKGLRGFIKIVQ